MIVNLLTEYLLECLSVKGGCTCSSESTHVKIPHCWKSHALAQIIFLNPDFVYIAAKLCLTDTTTGVSQVQLNSLADGVHISAKVLDNLKNSAVSHTARIELHNVGGQVVPQAGWKLFFHSTYLLLPTIFPKTLSSLLEVENVIVSMHGGDLYSMEPASNFKQISPGETRLIEIDTAVWSISETDFMPNWYFVSTRPGVEPKVASTTKAMSLDFVKPFDDVRQWKRYTFDRYNPFTPQDRMERLYVRDTTNIDKPVIPTPRSISVVNAGATITIDASWNIIKMTGSTATVADYARRKYIALCKTSFRADMCVARTLK